MAKAKDGMYRLTLSGALIILARAALSKYISMSKGLEKDATAMGKDVLAKQVVEEREALTEETMEKLSKAIAEAQGEMEDQEVELTSVEFRAIQNGIPKLIRDTRAAKGTVSSLGLQDVKDRLEEMAVNIETNLQSAFQDQLELIKGGEGEQAEEKKTKGKRKAAGK